MTDPRLRIMHGVCNYCYKSTPETQRGIDESIEDWQARRRGTGRDPKNRKRPCPHCSGTGRAQYCYVCGEKMLCGGREQPDPNVMYVMGFEPGPCLRAGRNTQPMYGGPESVMGEGVQKDMDAMVMGYLLGLVRPSTLGPAISLDETKKKILAEIDRKYKISVELQRNGKLREYGAIMKEIQLLEEELSLLLESTKESEE